jgi:hypothetical protein
MFLCCQRYMQMKHNDMKWAQWPCTAKKCRGALFAIPHRKGWGTAPFFTKSCRGAVNEALSRAFHHPCPKRLGWYYFSLSHAEGLATKHYHACFTIPRRKGWGTAPFFTKSCRRATNDALSSMFPHPSPKRLGDEALFTKFQTTLLCSCIRVRWCQTTCTLSNSRWGGCYGMDFFVILRDDVWSEVTNVCTP